jgi:hypothetical protein
MTASERTVQLLAEIVKPVPIGTNLALLQLMWAMASGAFLQSRGVEHRRVNRAMARDSVAGNGLAGTSASGVAASGLGHHSLLATQAERMALPLVS